MLRDVSKGDDALPRASFLTAFQAEGRILREPELVSDREEASRKTTQTLPPLSLLLDVLNQQKVGTIDRLARRPA